VTSQLAIRVKRILGVGVPLFLFLVVFVIDIIRKGVEIDVVWVHLLRDALAVVAFYLSYIYLSSLKGTASLDPVKIQRILLLVGVTIPVAYFSLSLYRHGGFEGIDYRLVPKDYSTLFLAHMVSVTVGLLMLLILLYAKDLVFFKRRKGTGRNFAAFLIAVFATSASTFNTAPLNTSVLTYILLGVAIFLAVVNSFRLPWIVYLSKREKVYSLLWSLALLIAFVGITVETSGSSFLNLVLLYYSPPVRYFVSLTAMFCAIYFGVAFISTLFHFPTAEAFERKRAELSSLHNLSRLVARVLNFGELVDTVTKMTLEVCDAQSSWLEIVHARGVHPAGNGSGLSPNRMLDVVSSKNITDEEISAITSTNGSSLREAVFNSRKVLLINEVGGDKLTRHMKGMKKKIGSLLVVPLISHSEVTGILYATKEMLYGFDQEDIDVLSAFADQVSIAIENARLIEESIERERLQQEMLVAQSMQRRLLPQALPERATFDVDAVSSMAQEVGGDYYDFAFLDEERLAIIVGDVSGKGVPAAFYMAEVKGIFQSLSKLCRSPKEFVVKANSALFGTIDKRSFISILYAILNINTGQLIMARAGHCPMLHVTDRRTDYVRPTGLGLGLTIGPLFESATEERTLTLKSGDVCVFYSDGITESRGSKEEELGYERLKEIVGKERTGSAREIKEEILKGVREYTGSANVEDDMTLIVLKWGASKGFTELNVQRIQQA
jgi:sigma-B regulation protein RsbU (phosphoserine phosphatase)